MDKSAMVTVPRAVTVAAGVLAPGHLGELTQYMPFELADDVLEETLTAERRTRLLPSRVGIYFVLAMTMFPGLGYLRVWDKLTAAIFPDELEREHALHAAARVQSGDATPPVNDREAPSGGPDDGAIG